MKISNPLLDNNVVRKSAQILWKDAGLNEGRHLFETFSVPKDIIGDVFVNIAKYPNTEKNFMIEVKNRLGKLLGNELISIDAQGNKKIFGFNIQVDKEYQRKRFRIGELLRLASIMEMLKNESPHIQIYSKDTAVYFHSKYKFEPDITAFDTRDKALRDIISDKSLGFEDLKEAAQQILDSVTLSKDDAAAKRALCKDTNALLKKYIQRALLDEKPDKQHPFSFGFDMILKRDTVIENKDFFNSIFERQGIDYKI